MNKPITDRKGVSSALFAAMLFGISTPLAKILSPQLSPILLAGLLYLGSGTGLGLYSLAARWSKRANPVESKLAREDVPWLGLAVLFGGLVGPVLLMWGLTRTPASNAALLLNFEGALTALLAWFIFRENFDLRIAIGMALIVGGGISLSWMGSPAIGVPWGSLAVVGACLAWAIDNNLTRKISARNPAQIAIIKGLVAGSVNTTLAILVGHAALPSATTTLLAGVIGFLGYGVSLVLFIIALRHVGTARTSAYFSTAPFIGAAVSVVLLGERLSPGLIIAAGLMGAGVWLHLTERHEHLHRHEPLDHDHLHVHDEHHQHAHGPLDPPGEPHSHRHHHEQLVHAHPHFPDIHHRHRH
jgi:drug/metabolite transporter (DMT)-like permease